MGIKTKITLTRLNHLFPSYNVIEIIPTTTGIMDTTYIINTQTDSYILKHYDREISVLKNAKLLDELKDAGLNVSTLLEKKDSWYIYSKLKGQEPKHIKTFHIQSLARFLAKMHKYTYKKNLNNTFVKKQEINKMLKEILKHNYYSFKKYSSLQTINFENNGIIHGDIFKDNTVFDSSTIGVFDFSDSGDGSFAFDAGIALFGFEIDTKNRLFINLFLNTYNQNTTKKLTTKELQKYIKIASDFYGLKRIYRGL